MVADNQRGWHQSKQLIACVYRKSNSVILVVKSTENWP